MGRKSGDSWENFIGEMYRRYYDRLMIVACSYTHDRTKAEDLVQEAFLKAILSYRKGGSFLSWACRVIRNSFLDQYRREKRFAEEDIEGEAEIPAQEDLLADYIKGEERRRLAAMISALPLKYRDVMIQFLTESAILAACGGAIGVILAVSIVTVGGAALDLPVVIKPGVILLAVSFSAVVGIFFGIYPASKAAKADPIDALRYE